MNLNYTNNYIKSINKGLNNAIFHINNSEYESDYFFESLNKILIGLFNSKKKIFFFGNGASSAFANHMALDFSKNGKILSRSLSDSALLTALSNDFSFEEAMVEYMKIENIDSNDLVITISSSGNSNNIVSILNYCKKNNIKTLALSGLKNDNKSILLANYSIYIPMKTYGMVECIHQIFLHLILDNFMNIYEWDRDDYQNMNKSNYNI
jgi:D-sedoheptulose 7-phosphate isomerase